LYHFIFWLPSIRELLLWMLFCDFSALSLMMRWKMMLKAEKNLVQCFQPYSFHMQPTIIQQFRQTEWHDHHLFPNPPTNFCQTQAMLPKCTHFLKHCMGKPHSLIKIYVENIYSNVNLTKPHVHLREDGVGLHRQYVDLQQLVCISSN